MSSCKYAYTFVDLKNVSPNKVNDVITEEDRILALKNECMRLEAERLLTEEQHFHLMEEKQLREREEFVRKQEVCFIIQFCFLLFCLLLYIMRVVNGPEHILCKA